MSTKPGVTSSPSASIVWRAGPSTRPTSVMTPPSTATSLVREGAPVPSTSVPPLTTRSCSLIFPAPCDCGAGPLGPRSLLGGIPASLDARSWRCSCSQCGQHLRGEQALRGLGVIAVGAEACARNDEPFDTQPREGFESFDAQLRRADDREAIDEVGIERGGVRGGVAEVLVAVVATADFGDDRAVAFGEAGPGGARHRREVRERRDGTADQRPSRVDIGMAADGDIRPERDLARVATGVGGRLAR